MTRYVEYCRTNVDEAARARLDALAATTVEKCCLQRCGTCRAAPFLVVDGEPRRGESHERLATTVEREGEPDG